MKGWFTVDVHQAIEIIQQHGKLKVLDDVDLVVETRDADQMAAVSRKLANAFGEEAWLEPIKKKLLT